MNCLECGKNLIGSHRNRRYCSRRCQNRKFLRRFDKHCIKCGIAYKASEKSKFCSQSCSASSRADHLKKIQEAHRKYPKIEGLNRCQIYRKFNPEKGRDELTRDNIKRVLLIQFLGGKCVECGYEKDIRALQLDHIHNDGKEDRKRPGRSGKVCRYYVKNMEIAKNILQVLCANCHSIKTMKTYRDRK